MDKHITLTKNNFTLKPTKSQHQRPVFLDKNQINPSLSQGVGISVKKESCNSLCKA